MAFGNGAVHYQPTFVSARGFGWTLAHVLSYSNQLSEDFDFSNGFNWVVASQPFLVELPDAVVALVLNGHKSVRFAFDGSNWNAQHGAGCHGHLARAICHEPLSRNCSPLVSSLPKSLPLARFIHRQSGFWRNLLQRLLFRPAYPKHPVFERQRLRGETQAIGNA
ncbi:MAG: hypothetical protein HYS13_19665 [Planctomycetia bacterium]|nr:hypothetical protein [Planctomycetia bacterium]